MKPQLPLRQAAGPVAAALIPLALFYVLSGRPSLDLVVAVPVGHFYVVSLVALLSAGVAVAVGLAGIRLRNQQVIYLSLAFISLTVVFTVHGLSTPGILIGPSHVPHIAAYLSMMLTALWLYLSSLNSDHPLLSGPARRPYLLVLGWTVLLVVLGAAVLLRPSLADWIPLHQIPQRWYTAAFTVIPAGAAGYRYLAAYRYSRFPLQLAVTYAAGWLAVSQVIAVTGEVWRLSWWLYHVLLLMMVIVMVAGLLRQHAAQGGGLEQRVRGLFAVDPIERLEAGISPSVRALVTATEARDPYTAGHSYRVARSSVMMGEAMGLAPEQLRALAQGGMVHDVGKLEVPDAILNKPSALTADELSVARRHPLTGHRICSQLGLMEDELAIVRWHHEHWGGGGYPDGLAGEEIPLLARILAVADVYDALTSDRAYRKAWPHERARRYILEAAGSQFDPSVVEVWADLTDSGPLPASPPAWLSSASHSGD